MARDETQATKRMEQLKNEIRKQDRLYYEEAAPIISDREYDRLYKELVDLETQFPDLVTPDSPTQRVGGKPLKAFEQVSHLIPMLSLDNTYSEQEVKNFYARIQRLLPNEKIPVVIEPKVDGVAFSLIYENGRLRQAATRGDGNVGDNITQNVRTIRSVPERLRGAAPKLLEVRGEVYMDKHGFEKLNDERRKTDLPLFANPRNAAAGSLKQLDPAIVAKRPLGVVLYGTGATEGADVDVHSEIFPLPKKLGLPATERWWVAESVEEILGDTGGGYFLSIEALRLILREYDLHRGEMQFTAKILHALSLNTLDELVRWVQTADKMEIAMLAPVVFEAAVDGDPCVIEIVEEGARVLCEYTEAVASRLHLLAPKVALMGGLFYRDSVYTHAFRRRLKKNLPDARVTTAERPPELGAAWLAAETGDPVTVRPKLSEKEIEDLAAALTEQRNPRSENLEKMGVRELVELFVEEEKFVEDALRAATEHLARAIEMVTESLRKGGRLFYVGTGSSGRIGVLDASEIPPTFGASPDLVQGVIAGGVTALYRSVEGAEDKESAGALAMRERGIRNSDVVVGITASGRTPFVLGALACAKSLGAKTILLTCNPTVAGIGDPGPPGSTIPATVYADLVIALAVGPEVLTGSTRLKAGTATKVALNIVSTGAMVALGKVHGNLMIDLHTTNAKLRDRAVRVVADLAQCDYDSAHRQLEAADWNLRAVVEKL